MSWPTDYTTVVISDSLAVYYLGLMVDVLQMLLLAASLTISTQVIASAVAAAQLLYTRHVQCMVTSLTVAQ